MWSTTSRILMTEWQGLAKIIVSHSTAAKEKPITDLADLENFDIENLENLTLGTAEELPHILTEKQIQTALQGPFGSLIRQKMAAYSKIARFRIELHLSKEEIFKNKRATIPEAEQIPAKKLSKITIPELDRMQRELDDLIQAHNQQWLDYTRDWSEFLLHYMTQEAKLELTERESKEFMDEDVSSELLPRFTEIGLKPPKKDYEQMSLGDYLLLKATLTTQSCLSRQMLPHTEKEIAALLANFAPHFTTLAEQIKQFLSDQQTQTVSIIEPLGGLP